MNWSDRIWAVNGLFAPKLPIYLRLENRATGQRYMSIVRKSDGLFWVDIPPGTYRFEFSPPGQGWRDVSTLSPYEVPAHV